MTEIKKGSLVITSRNLYGKVVDIEPDPVETKFKIKIGSKIHYIYESQVSAVEDIVKLKAHYILNIGGHVNQDNIIIAVKRNDIIFDENKPNILKELAENTIFNILKVRVKVDKISIP